MKKLIIATAILFASISNASAQAFSEKSMYLTLGFGGANYHYFGGASSYYSGYGYSYNYPAFSTLTGQFDIQAEWSIHKYVGIGGFLGVGGGNYGYRGVWGYSSSSYGVFNVPVAVFGNFHFYQLIADKVSGNIHADKLDVYAGISVGSGLGMVFYTNDTHPCALLIVGGNVGARYWFKERMAVNLELGYGKTFANVGLTFKVK